MYEYKNSDNKVVVRSNVSEDSNCTAILIEVFDVPFMTGLHNHTYTRDSLYESMMDAIIHHFGSISYEIYREVSLACKFALDDCKCSPK